MSGGTYSTTLSAVAFSGTATDTGSNLSRVKVYNATRGGDPSWDYGLSGNSHSFHIENVGLAPGNNTMQVTVFDRENNASPTTTITIKRETNVLGAVIIVAGHNEDYSLQTNIDNSANRAYRIFRAPGSPKTKSATWPRHPRIRTATARARTRRLRRRPTSSTLSRPGQRRGWTRTTRSTFI